MKPTDKAILGMVSKSPGRNASEPIGGLKKKEIWRPSPLLRGEGSMDRRTLTDAARHSGGVVGAARRQGHVNQLEKPYSSRRESGGAGSRITATLSSSSSTDFPVFLVYVRLTRESCTFLCAHGLLAEHRTELWRATTSLGWLSLTLELTPRRCTRRSLLF
jgi:hypothetical protein